MSGRDELRPASFRGVPFATRSAGGITGRRMVLHEFPKRDEVATEDMGRAPRKFTLSAYVLGDDYMAARNALIVAIETRGPGLLVHPYFGELTVVINGEASWEETTRDGGMATFQLPFAIAEEVRFPSATDDTREALVSRSAAGQEAAAVEFEETFAVEDAPVYVIEGARDVADAAVEAMRRAAASISTTPAALTDFVDVVNDVSVATAALIGAPADLAGSVRTLVARLRVAAARPRAAIRALRTVFGFGDGLPAVPGNTAPRAQQVSNQNALTRLVRVMAVLEAVRACADAEFESLDDALAVRDVLADALDALSDTAEDDRGYQALVAARAALLRDIDTRAAQLPRLRQVQLGDPMPALVMAWDIYGDATRADEIVTRNQLRDPLRLPSGRPMEVLDDVR